VDHRAEQAPAASWTLFARDLQIQERLTTQIEGWLQTELEPKGVGVVLEAWP
jgi:GTP cyclohydrolase I